MLFLHLILCVPSHLQHPSSTTPPIDIAPSRLKLMRRGPDRKSEFLRALKDEGTGELTTGSSPGTSGEVTPLWIQSNAHIVCLSVCLKLWHLSWKRKFSKAVKSKNIKKSVLSDKLFFVVLFKNMASVALIKAAVFPLCWTAFYCLLKTCHLNS